MEDFFIIMSQPTYNLGTRSICVYYEGRGVGFFEGGNAKKGVSRFGIGTKAKFVEDKWSLHYCHPCSVTIRATTTTTTITLFTLIKRIIRQKRV